MIYKIISPIVVDIDGDTIKEAFKNYLKYNYNYTINQMILQDRLNYIQANMNYYQKNGRNKVKINMSPMANYPGPGSMLGPGPMPMLGPGPMPMLGPGSMLGPGPILGQGPMSGAIPVSPPMSRKPLNIKISV
jgi:hypothetical protein